MPEEISQIAQVFDLEFFSKLQLDHFHLPNIIPYQDNLIHIHDQGC